MWLVLGYLAEMVRLSRTALFMTIVTAIISCADDGLPTGLYDYQVTRLMTADSSKIWSLQPQNIICDSAGYFVFERNIDDSIVWKAIRWNCDSLNFIDTVALSKGIPGHLGILFTDTIRWENTNPWIVHEVTNNHMIYQDTYNSQQVQLVHYNE